MMRYPTLICIFLIVLKAWPSEHHETRVMCRPLPTQQLLPVANVTHLLQDEEGYMWYGTNGGGVCRDNGYQLDVFRSDRNTPQLIASNVVTCMAEAPHGRILFGTQAGLYLIDKQDYQLSAISLHSPSIGQQKGASPSAKKPEGASPINALFVDHSGQTWVGAGNRIVCLDKSDLHIAATYDVGHLGTDNVTSFYEDSRHRLWALLWTGGWLRLDKSEGQFQRQPWPYDVQPRQMWEDDKNGCFWVATWGKGICRISTEGTAIREGEPGQMVISMLHDKQHGLLWATTMDNLVAYRIEPDGLQQLPLPAEIPVGKKILDQLLQDRQGNIYVAGFTPHTFVLTPDESALRRITAPAISRLTGYPLLADRAVPEGGDFWIWQGRIGLTYYQPATDRLSQAKDFGINVERNIAASHQGEGLRAVDANRLLLIAATPTALHSEVTASLPEAESIRAFAEDEQSRIWIASDRALHVHSLVGGQTTHLCQLPAQTHAIATDPDGTVFLATDRGLLRWDGSSLARIDDRHEEDFTSVATTPDGTVYAATYGGSVLRYDKTDGRLQLDSLMSNMNGDAVKELQADALGHLWLLSDQYVREFNPQNHASRTIRNNAPFVDVTYFYSLTPTGLNSVCIGGGGALCVVPASAALNQTAPVVQPKVSAVIADDRKYFVPPSCQKLTFGPDQRNWEIQLTTLNHMHAADIRFAYQIKGLQDSWTYLPEGDNTVELTAVPKGTYTLLLQATDRYGSWGAATSVLTLVRRPAWYETWWAYLLYIMAIMALGAFLWQVERRISLLSKLIRRRREVRLDEIQLTPEAITTQRIDDTFMRNVLACVQQNISRTDYTVEQLSADMCMSRMNLYRRLHTLTGQTPTEFIRDIRLKQAAQLLTTDSRASVADIATRVGFANAGYFSKLFKEKFGLLPKDYRHTPPQS